MYTVFYLFCCCCCCRTRSLKIINVPPRWKNEINNNRRQNNVERTVQRIGGGWMKTKWCSRTSTQPSPSQYSYGTFTKRQSHNGSPNRFSKERKKKNFQQKKEKTVPSKQAIIRQLTKTRISSFGTCEAFFSSALHFFRKSTGQSCGCNKIIILYWLSMTRCKVFFFLFSN